MSNLLRAQAITMQAIELENQHGPVRRQVLTFTVSPLFPGEEPVDATQFSVVLDDAQLHRLRHALLELDLPKTSPMPPGALQ